MNKSALFVCALALLIKPAMAQSLSDFKVPAGANTPAEASEMRKVESPQDVKKTKNDKLASDVVSAKTTSDAANAAQADLKDTDGGARFIATGSGVGALASGCVFYRIDDVKNPNLVLINQRRAFLGALLKARSELAKLLNGVSVEGKQFLGEQLQAIDDEIESRANIKESSVEAGAERVKAMIRGAVVYDFEDDPQAGRVRVTIITTPKTQGAVQTLSSNQVNARSLEDGLQQIFNQLRNGLMPPDGGNIITCEDGRIAWVGYGSQIIRRNSDPRISSKLQQAARDQSIRRARQSLLAVINGESILSESKDFESLETETKQFEAKVDEAGNQSVQKLEKQQFLARCQMSVKESFGAERIGELPPGITVKTYETRDGNWVYSVAVYFAEATDAAKALAKSMQESSPLSAVSKQEFAIKPDGSFERDKEGRLIPRSMGKGRVAKDKDF